MTREFTVRDGASKQLTALFAPAMILRLKDPAFKVSWLGESQLEQRTAVGVEVARKSGEEFASPGATIASKARLSFDKETGLLLKSEWDFPPDSSSGKGENLYLDYGVLAGIPIARHQVCKMDGKVAFRTEVLEFKTADRLDDKLFEKP